MSIRSTIQKIILSVVLIIVTGGILMLLIAANGKKSASVCNGQKITINTQKDPFIDEQDVMKLMVTAMNGSLKDQPIANFNLRRLEELLEQNVWVRSAEMWFDNKDVLHVVVTGREPIARVFTSSSNSFYLDKENQKLPLSDKITARVPLFTGFPEKMQWTPKDSVLAKDVVRIASFIGSNPFWMSQVSQVDIVAYKKFEMIPLIGNNIIRLGDAKNIEQKFARLYTFYEHVLSKTGFETYSVIDVQYKGQVIGTKRN